MRAIAAFTSSHKFLVLAQISVRLDGGQSLYVNLSQGKLMRTITLFLFAALLCFSSSARAQQLPGNPNSGSITVSSSVVNTLNPYTNTADGTINIESSGTLTNGTPPVGYGGPVNATLKNDGTLTNSGTLAILQGSTIENFGTLTNSGMLSNSGEIINNSGGTLINNGTIDSELWGYIDNNGVISGTGHITGNVSGSGTIAPGQSAGVFTIDGQLTHSGGGHEIELGGLFDGGGNNSLTEFDRLDVTGDVELAGVLDVYLIDSFELLAGMSFDILKVGGTLTGQYDGLDEGHKVGSFSGTNLFITYAAGGGNDVRLFSRAVPEPAAILLALFGLALLPRRRRR